MKKNSHPIGTLVPPDAPINAYGDVWGKLKLTGDDAEQFIGFRPKKGAIGVLLSRRKYKDKNGKLKRGIFAISLMPHKTHALTQKNKPVYDLTRVLATIVKDHLSDIIHTIWDPLVTDRNKKPYDGYRYFMSINRKGVSLSHKWDKLLISNGKLKPPHAILPSWYDPDKKQITILLPINQSPINQLTNYQIGIGILDTITGSFFHIPPDLVGQASRLSNTPHPSMTLIWKLKQVQKHYSGRGNQKSKRFCLYNYHRKQNSSFGFRHSEFSYSPSIARRIKTLDKIPSPNATDKTHIIISLIFPEESFFLDKLDRV